MSSDDLEGKFELSLVIRCRGTSTPCPLSHPKPDISTLASDQEQYSILDSSDGRHHGLLTETTTWDGTNVTGDQQAVNDQAAFEQNDDNNYLDDDDNDDIDNSDWESYHDCMSDEDWENNSVASSHSWQHVDLHDLPSPYERLLKYEDLIASRQYRHTGEIALRNLIRARKYTAYVPQHKPYRFRPTSLAFTVDDEQSRPALTFDFPTDASNISLQALAIVVEALAAQGYVRVNIALLHSTYTAEGTTTFEVRLVPKLRCQRTGVQTLEVQYAFVEDEEMMKRKLSNKTSLDRWYDIYNYRPDVKMFVRKGKCWISPES